MAEFEGHEGVWRTIGGRRVFIRDGEDLSTAMQRSGKFSRVQKNQDLYKKLDEEKKKIDEKIEKKDNEKKDISSEEAINEFMNADNGDWNNMSQAERDKTCENILKDFENKYGDKLSDNKFREEVLDGLEDQNFHTMVKIIDSEYNDKYGTKKLNEKYEEYEKSVGKETKAETKTGDLLKENSQEEKDKTSFTQKVDIDGGEYTYDADRLKRMEEHGTKPMANSYTGGGWEGTKYDSTLSTKDIAKNISDYSKKEFPDVKISRKTDYNGIDINIMSSGKDLYANETDIDKMSDRQVSDTIRDSIGGYTRLDEWLNKNKRKNANGSFTTKDERDYLKEELNTYKNRNGYNVSGNEWYLSDYGKKVVSGLNKEMNSYNYDDSDGMVDYFNTNFYGYVKIGKWDKPYETTTNKKSMNDALRQKGYQKYMKEHPASKMTFEEFINKK